MNFDPSTFCTESAGILVFVGWILTIFKVAIPLVIVGLGMFDFGKAVVASEEDEIKKQTTRLVYRAIAGVVIFFVPTFVMMLFEAIGDYDVAGEQTSFENCKNCILKPWSCVIEGTGSRTNNPSNHTPI